MFTFNWEQKSFPSAMDLSVHNNVFFPNHKSILAPEAKDKLAANRRLLPPNSLMAKMPSLIILRF